MDHFNWLFVGGVGLMIIGISLMVWGAVHEGGQADDAADEAAPRKPDGFTPSMQRYGYVQDARNKGDV